MQHESCQKIAMSPVFASALQTLGDYWRLRIIVVLLDGPLRFCEIERAIPEVNPVTLTSRLKKLEEAGFIRRDKDQDDRQAVIYSLTKTGQDIQPVLEAIKTFAETHNP